MNQITEVQGQQEQLDESEILPMTSIGDVEELVLHGVPTGELLDQVGGAGSFSPR